MQIINLYRYIRPDGGVTVSTVKPDTDYTELYRLVADEGKVLTNNNTSTTCVDTTDPALWVEVEDTTNNKEENNSNFGLGSGSQLTAEILEKAKAYDILMSQQNELA